MYDGDGSRVKQANPDGSITLFLDGGIYTVADAAGSPQVTKYYSVAGQRVALSGPDGLKYLLTDHLGSVSAVLDANGSLVSEQRYLPFGGERPEGGITQTDFGFTGQRDLAAAGLMDYNARWYSQTVGVFTQLDMVSNFANPQSLNRYGYVGNNPLNRIDPTGNTSCPDYDPTCAGGPKGAGGTGTLVDNEPPKPDFCELHPHAKACWDYDGRELPPITRTPNNGNEESASGQGNQCTGIECDLEPTSDKIDVAVFVGGGWSYCASVCAGGGIEGADFPDNSLSVFTYSGTGAGPDAGYSGALYGGFAVNAKKPSDYEGHFDVVTVTFSYGGTGFTFSYFSSPSGVWGMSAGWAPGLNVGISYLDLDYKLRYTTNP